ncbi:MAG: hypothetical protein J6L85_06335 [Clostridia bacterium]|nr:hypothetical protein [Clostridia bacterium]
MKGFYARRSGEELSCVGAAFMLDGKTVIGRLRILSGEDNIFFRESSILCFRSERALRRAMPYFERAGQLLAVICAESIMSGELLHELEGMGIAYFLLSSGEEIPDTVEGRIAIIDASVGRLIIDPRIDTLDRYSPRYKEDGEDAFGIKRSVTSSAQELSEYLSGGRRDSGGILCRAEDIAAKGDFFEGALALTEMSPSGSLCVRVSVPDTDGEDSFCERIDVLFRSAVYGEVSVMLEGYRSAADIERAVRLMYKSYCRLENEGREINTHLARGLMVDSPIWLTGQSDLSGFDFLCSDFDRLCGLLLGVSPIDALRDRELAGTLCRFWENYRRTHQFHGRTELRAKSDLLFDSKIFIDWVDFMEIGEVYLPARALAQKNT